jgi:6-phosphogluconolactonase
MNSQAKRHPPDQAIPAANPLASLHRYGQAPWLDFLARGFIAEGHLKKLVEHDGLTGVTSNPSIFEKAIGGSTEYDSALKEIAAEGDFDVMKLYERLAIEDIRHAADVLHPVFEATKGADGYVSLEVSPWRSNDAAHRSSVNSGRRHRCQCDRGRIGDIRFRRLCGGDRSHSQPRAIKQGGCAMSKAATADARVFEDAEVLAHNAAEWLGTLAQASNRRFAICCSGGSTPKRLYEVLAEPAVASRFPWERVHWLWGDERFVPHDHPDSNYRMVFDALLSRVPVPAGNIHAVPTAGLSPEEAAAAYEKTLMAFYGADTLVPTRPLFDVTLLGIGEDGHTASLFPGHPRAGRASPLGSRRHRRQIRGAHHVDLSGARQQPRRRFPGDGSRQAGACRTRPIRRSYVAGGPDSARRPPSLVHRPRRGIRIISDMETPDVPQRGGK